ncbi:MAG: ZIP family metal transporter [Firmicutes bacterium]|nr:ZIP family metal transporter [Bacillota bacterium]
MWESVLLSTLAGLATGIGAILVILFGRPSGKILSVMLGMAGGIMLAISVFDLIPEAAELGNTTTTIVGFVLGAGLMALLDVLLPHIHLDLHTAEGGADCVVASHSSHNADLSDALTENGNGNSGGCLAAAGATALVGERKPRKGWFRSAQDLNMLRCGLFMAIGIALHNLPEGLAIGAGYISSASLGLTIAISLALHNVPEGMVTAAPLLLGGVNKWLVIGITTAAGLMTPLGTFLGAAVLSVSPEFISSAMALAGGAMIYIVSDELIPQSHEYHSHAANFGLVAGFVLGYML